MYTNNLFNMYKSLLISNMNERIFSMLSTPGMTENIKVHFIFYVTEFLCLLCLGDVFRFKLDIGKLKSMFELLINNSM